MGTSYIYITRLITFGKINLAVSRPKTDRHSLSFQFDQIY